MLLYTNTSSPVWNTAATALKALAKKLGELPCLLIHGNESCSTETHQPNLDFAAVYLKVAFRILENDNSDRLADTVRAAVYDSLGKSLRHHTAATDERMFDDILGFITRGMRDPERLVRLAAG